MRTRFTAHGRLLNPPFFDEVSPEEHARREALHAQRTRVPCQRPSEAALRMTRSRRDPDHVEAARWRAWDAAQRTTRRQPHG